jgi:hypothetical protein
VTIAYRPAELDDAQFIVSQWSRCFKSSRSAGIIANEDWPRIMHPTIQKIVARPDVKTIVAYENTDSSFLYGFITATPDRIVPIVYFVCVKEAYRRAGYARGLFAAMDIDPSERFIYTCWTPVIPKLTGQIPLAKHDPGFARIVGYTEPEPRIDKWKR